MSRIRANNFTDKAGTGAPTFPYGVNVTGVSTFGNVVVGGATTDVVINGNLRVTGIITTGTSSITIDAENDQITVGSATTIHSTGYQIGSSNLHSTGLEVQNLNVSGVVTTTTLKVGTGVTISGGIVTATSFYGDGTNLTNTGSTLSAASGSQRVVLTSQTSGTMTSSATVSNLTYNASTGSLSATSFGGNLVSGGISTVHTLYHPGGSNPLIVTRFGGLYTIHVSDSGDDSTGNGSSGSPYRSLNKAFSMVPDIVNKQAVYIKILGGTYNATSNTYYYGQLGSGFYGSGQNITLGADSATTFNWNGYYLEIIDCEVAIAIQNLNFVSNSGLGCIFTTRSRYLWMKNSCTWTSNSTYGWSYGGGGSFYRTEVNWQAPVTLTSSASAGLGAVFVFDDSRVFWNANLTKSGTRFGNHAISVTNGSWVQLNSCTISNFSQGVVNGRNHYDAETGGHTLFNGVTISNCTTGLLLVNGAVSRNYSITFSSNTTNSSASNSFST